MVTKAEAHLLVCYIQSRFLNYVFLLLLNLLLYIQIEEKQIKKEQEEIKEETAPVKKKEIDPILDDDDDDDEDINRDVRQLVHSTLKDLFLICVHSGKVGS